MNVPISASAINAPAIEDIKVSINGGEYQPKSAPFIYNDTVYLPVRDVGELLGTVVFWNSSLKRVTMTYPELTVNLNYGSMEATVNGNSMKLTTSLRMVNGRIFVPLRFFSEAIDAGVEWKDSTRTMSITKSDDYVKGVGSNTTIWLNKMAGDIYLYSSSV